MTDDSFQIFADECEDLLAVAEQALIHLDEVDSAVGVVDAINNLFRTFHTIKGAAGLFGLNSIVAFTHSVESVLGKIREGNLDIDEKLVSLFLLSRDHLEALVANSIKGNTDLDASLQGVDDQLSEKLNRYLYGMLLSDAEINTEVMTNAVERENGGVENEGWHISLRFGVNVLKNGMDPISFIGYLGKIGEIKNVALIDDAIPQWSDFDAENCYLGFEIKLDAPNATKEELEEVFEFVIDDCKINILPPFSHIDDYINMINALPEEDMRLGEILVACGALTSQEKDNILNTQDHISDEITAGGELDSVPLLGVVAVDNKVVEQDVVDAAVKKQKKVKQQRDNEQQTIRVNALKLENLVDLVGELVIGSANSQLHASKVENPELKEAMGNLLRLVEEVRDTALSLRMVQIGETFNRYKRVVREVSRELGKEIDLVISGAETELDKTIIEKIGDPLMHLIRNAVDHGIESPEARLEAGKPAKGTVSLDAFHESGSIVIQIKDDGGGLSKEKILKKALEKGIVPENHQLTEQEVYRLIFEAGFSTADTVSNLSGRGVGMDVVRQNIESLRGQVDIESEEGVGSTMSIRLPLTLAIIDGFQMRVGDDQYIVPLDLVEECIELDSTLQSENDGGNYINLRGEILPFIQLSEVFGTSLEKSKKHRDNIVVVQFAGKKAGFVVDELLGEHQTVIKPLGKIFQNLKGISGATILGSGEVAMIIDVPEMVNRVINIGQNQFSTSAVIH